MQMSKMVIDLMVSVANMTFLFIKIHKPSLFIAVPLDMGEFAADLRFSAILWGTALINKSYRCYRIILLYISLPTMTKL